MQPTSLDPRLPDGIADALAAYRGAGPCTCSREVVPRVPPRVVLTGGPGGGKTAVLEVVRRHFCRHVVVLPEAASILFGGGFPRGLGVVTRQAVQRAIFHVQDELERIAIAADDATLVLCDRGVVDGIAYWCGEGELLDQVGVRRADALARYAGVIHLRTPDARGYDRHNPIRVETVAEAAAIDERIAAAWEGHPARVFVPARTSFVAKLADAMQAIEGFLPAAHRHGLLAGK